MGRGTVKIKKTPSGKKQTPPGAVPDLEAIAHRPLSWHIAEVDFSGVSSWSKLDVSHVSDLHRTLLDYERETFATLKRNQRARQIPTEDLCPAAQRRLATMQRDDAELWELRLGHLKWRAWGVIRGSIFYLLWWDPDHSVCPERPKHSKRL